MQSILEDWTLEEGLPFLVVLNWGVLFFQGRLISTYVDRPYIPYVKEALANLGMNCYLKMLLKDNYIHGDLHPVRSCASPQRGLSGCPLHSDVGSQSSCWSATDGRSILGLPCVLLQINCAKTVVGCVVTEEDNAFGRYDEVLPPRHLVYPEALF